MGELPNMYPHLSNQTQFRLKKINEIKDYFIAEICEKESLYILLSKYIAAFGYFDNALIVLYATSGGISIASFATVIGAPVGIASACEFSIITGIVKNY